MSTSAAQKRWKASKKEARQLGRQLGTWSLTLPDKRDLQWWGTSNLARMNRVDMPWWKDADEVRDGLVQYRILYDIRPWFDGPSSPPPWPYKFTQRVGFKENRDPVYGAYMRSVFLRRVWTPQASACEESAGVALKKLN
jgi:hypothetical protein